MVRYCPLPTYEKEYYESVSKRNDKIHVYENYCVGDVVYYKGRDKAIIYKEIPPRNIMILFEDDYTSRLIDKKYIYARLTKNKCVFD